MNFDENVRQTFDHKNVCKATWDPANIEALDEPTLFFERGQRVKCQNLMATVLWQRRGADDEPGKVALEFDDPASAPERPICLLERDCPHFAQKHGFLTEKGKTYILLKNSEWKWNDDPSQNYTFRCFVTEEYKEMRVCQKCKGHIKENAKRIDVEKRPPRLSLAMTELFVCAVFDLDDPDKLLPIPGLVNRRAISAYRSQS